MGRSRRSRYSVPADHHHDSDDEDCDNPEILEARAKVARLRAEYRTYRKEGQKGKLQMALLDYDLAVEDLKDLEVQYALKNKKSSKSQVFCLVACLPCMLLFQYFCCVSTASTGEFSKKQKKNAMISEQLSLLAGGITSSIGRKSKG